MSEPEGASARADLDVVLSIPVTYHATGERLHCPMVAATVNGVPTHLIVDTGATDHIITLDLARAAGVDLTDGPPGTDAAGTQVPSWHAGPISVTVAASSVTFDDVVAIDGPVPFTAWNVGGFLSPQRLRPDATIVLDLVADSLTAFTGPSDLVLAHFLELHRHLRRVNGTRHAAGTIGVHAILGPAGPVVALLDTGASGTEVACAGPGDAPSTVAGRGVSGTPIISGELLEQQIVLGDVRRVLPSLWVRDHIPAPEGAAVGEIPKALIGMDLLAGSVVVIPPGVTSIWWLLPDD